MNEKELILAILRGTGAVQRGEFTLASGQKSDIYIDMRRAVCSAGLAIIGEALTSKISNPNSLSCLRTIAAVADGGIPVMAAVLSTKRANVCVWQGGWIRKEAKSHGDQSCWAGQPPSEDVVFVEDVITTGGSAQKAMQQLQASYPIVKIHEVVCILNRGSIKDIDGVPVHSILTMDDIHREFCKSK